MRALTDPTTGGRSSFSVRCGTRNVQLEIATDSDWDPTSLTLACAYDFAARADVAGYRDAGGLVATRPLGIVLTRENAADRAAKAEGVSVEWQSGDPAFDDGTYVKSDATDPRVLDAVLNSTVRGATLELLALGCEEIRLDVGGSISTTVPAREFKSAQPSLVRTRLQGVLEAFARLLSDIPTVRHSGLAHPRPPLSRVTFWLGAVGAAGWLLNVGWAGMVATASASLLGKKTADIAVGPSILCVVVGLVAGFVGASLYGGAVRERARGRSDAHQLGFRAQLSAFGGFSVLAFTVALVVAVAVAS